MSVFAEAGLAGDLLPLLSDIVAPTLLRADPSLGSTLGEAVWQRAQYYLPARSRAVQIDGAMHKHPPRLLHGLHAGRRCLLA